MNYRADMERASRYANCPGCPAYRGCAAEVYGGIERVVSFLTEELVSMGHEVTLFASGDSGPRAKLRRGGHVRCGSRRRSVTRSHRIW